MASGAVNDTFLEGVETRKEKEEAVGREGGGADPREEEDVSGEEEEGQIK
jgi:hypothetical protein